MTPHDRPRDFGLRHMRLPVGAYASILHRASGILFLPVVAAGLVLWRTARTSRAGFHAVGSALTSPAAHILGPLAVWVAAQHLFGGIRYLLLDSDIGFGRARSRSTAAIVIAAALVAAGIAGWLWP